jgi:hypothetical protein
MAFEWTWREMNEIAFVVVLGKMNRWLSSSLGEIRLIWDGVDET